MQNLEKIVKELSERALREDHEKRRLEVLKILSHLYDKAATYVNIIMAIGYAGFFAVWSNMKVYMSAFDMRISALCMVASVVLFVMWEVIKMIITSSSLHKLQDVINASPDNFSAKLATQQKEAAIIDVQVMKWWPIVLFFTTLTALVAANILVYSFIINL